MIPVDQSKDLGTLPGDWNGLPVQSIPDSSACEKESRGQQGGEMISFGFKHSSEYRAKRNILEMEVIVSSHGRQILKQAYGTTRPRELVVLLLIHFLLVVASSPAVSLYGGQLQSWNRKGSKALWFPASHSSVILGSSHKHQEHPQN